MLYPLVKSTLLEEVLRTWQRSAEAKKIAANEEEEVDSCLNKLLEFLKIEVDNEEDVNLVTGEFTIREET